MNLGGQTTKILDRGSIELLGPYGLEKGLIEISKSFTNLNVGNVANYALFILIGLVFYSISFISLDLNVILIVIIIYLQYLNKK